RAARLPAARTLSPRPRRPFPTRRSSDLDVLQLPAGDEGLFKQGAAPARQQKEDGVRLFGPGHQVEGGLGGPEGIFVRHRVPRLIDRKSTRLNSSHVSSSYAVFCWQKKNERAAARRRTRPVMGTGSTNSGTSASREDGGSGPRSTAGEAPWWRVTCRSAGGRTAEGG